MKLSFYIGLYVFFFFFQKPYINGCMDDDKGGFTHKKKLFKRNNTIIMKTQYHLLMEILEILIRVRTILGASDN